MIINNEIATENIAGSQNMNIHCDKQPSANGKKHKSK